MASKRFHVGDLLSVTDGRLVSPRYVDALYDVCDFVTGEQHMTHQLPRVMETIRPWLLEQHPWLAGVVFDFKIPPDSSRDESSRIVFDWLAGVVAKYGEMHEVEQMPLGTYVGREPLAELREMAPNAEIIAVQMPKS